METALWLDFNKYSTVTFNAVEDQVLFTTEIDSITYTFTKEYIARDKDTFPIELHSKSVFFNGNIKEQGNIDALKLETSKKFLNQKLFIYKKNDASAFLN